MENPRHMASVDLECELDRLGQMLAEGEAELEDAFERYSFRRFNCIQYARLNRLLREFHARQNQE